MITLFTFEFRVHLVWFEGDGTKVEVDAEVGQTLLEVAIEQDIDLEGNQPTN